MVQAMIEHVEDDIKTAMMLLAASQASLFTALKMTKMRIQILNMMFQILYTVVKVHQ